MNCTIWLAVLVAVRELYRLAVGYCRSNESFGNL